MQHLVRKPTESTIKWQRAGSSLFFIHLAVRNFFFAQSHSSGGLVEKARRSKCRSPYRPGLTGKVSRKHSTVCIWKIKVDATICMQVPGAHNRTMVTRTLCSLDVTNAIHLSRYHTFRFNGCCCCQCLIYIYYFILFESRLLTIYFHSFARNELKFKKCFEFFHAIKHKLWIYFNYYLYPIPMCAGNVYGWLSVKVYVFDSIPIVYLCAMWCDFQMVRSLSGALSNQLT